MKYKIVYNIETCHIVKYAGVSDGAITPTIPVDTGEDFITVDLDNFVNKGYYYVYNSNLEVLTENEFRLRINPPRGWKMSFPTKALVDIRTVEQAKQYKWDEIKIIRSNKELENFVYDSHEYYADKERIPGAVQLAVFAKAANQAFSIDWTTADNTVVTLNADQMIGLGIALGTFINDIYTVARVLRADIEACTTNAEVDAIEWPA